MARTRRPFTLEYRVEAGSCDVFTDQLRPGNTTVRPPRVRIAIATKDPGL